MAVQIRQPNQLQIRPTKNKPKFISFMGVEEKRFNQVFYLKPYNRELKPMMETAFATGAVQNSFGKLACNFALDRVFRDYNNSEFDYNAHKVFRDYFEFVMAECKGQLLKKDMNFPIDFAEDPDSGETFQEYFDRVCVHLDQKYTQVSKSIEEARREICEYRKSRNYHRTEEDRQCENRDDCLPKIVDRAEHLELDFRTDSPSFVYHFCKHEQEISEAGLLGDDEVLTPRKYLELAQSIVRGENHVTRSEFTFEIRRDYVDEYDDATEQQNDDDFKMRHYVLIDKIRHVL